MQAFNFGPPAGTTNTAPFSAGTQQGFRAAPPRPTKRHGADQRIPPRVWRKGVPTDEQLRTLGSDLSGLLRQPELSDVTFVLDDGSSVHAMRAIIASRSEPFRAMLYGNMAEASQSRVKLSGMNTRTLRALVEWAFTGGLVRFFESFPHDASAVSAESPPGYRDGSPQVRRTRGSHDVHALCATSPSLSTSQSLGGMEAAFGFGAPAPAPSYMPRASPASGGPEFSQAAARLINIGSRHGVLVGTSFIEV